MFCTRSGCEITATVADKRMVRMVKTMMPEIHPRRAPASTVIFSPVRRRYRYTAKNPPATGTASAKGPATDDRKAERRKIGTPVASATRTAIALRKLIGGGSAGD